MATPLLMVPVPRTVIPSWNVTLPLAPAVTVAASVTAAPKLDGFGEETRATVEVAVLTTCDTAVETEPL